MYSFIVTSLYTPIDLVGPEEVEKVKINPKIFSYNP